jgi:hypothetical protein
MTRRSLISVCFLVVGTTPLVLGGTTATFDLTGTNNGANMGGVYTSPYFAKITTGTTTVSTAAICDDFSDDSYIGETWTADLTQYSALNTSTNSSLNNSTVLWQGTTWQGTPTPTILTQAQEYMAAAILTEDLLPIYSTNPTLAGEYGYGIWALTYPSTLPADQSPQHYLDAGVWSTVEALVNTAVAEATGSNPAYNSLSDYSNVQIYSYDSGASLAAGQPTGCGGTCPPPPQEFLVVGMPEPSLDRSLLFYFSAFACLIVFFRRRIPGRR